MKNIYILVILYFVQNVVLGQSAKISYSDLNSFMNSKNYPIDVFSGLENKGFLFSKKLKFNDWINDSNFTTDTCFVISYVNNQDNYFCTVEAHYCSSTKILPVTLYDSVNSSKFISVGFVNSSKDFELIKTAIIENCKFYKEESRSYNDLPLKEYFYKNNKGVIFSYIQYLNQNGMVYFIHVQNQI